MYGARAQHVGSTDATRTEHKRDILEAKARYMQHIHAFQTVSKCSRNTHFYMLYLCFFQNKPIFAHKI